ncbi:hypothetical protein CHS0354_010270 [Potamilus streckersoni]|uniref:Urease accessory protein F n=1 Tax=Potamilus streckersoni TaxID=2493646 RepID=A0AAE0SV29_9BIVA|nr:hypothetical protein CHS0354_010270 [Potamilus streckersoni]
MRMESLDNSDSILLTLLQICDSGFPTGGFSHSMGLECAVKQQFVKSKDSMKIYMACCLENIGSFAMPFVKEAHKNSADLDSLKELDDLCSACISNHVARRASTRQGRSLLDTCFQIYKHNQMSKMSESLMYKHQPIIFGALCGILGIDLQSTLIAFVFSSIRAVVTSAVRLDKVGPVEAQSIQLDLQMKIPDVVVRNFHRGSHAACMVYPHVDIIQSMHDTMFSKLFYS